MWCLVFLPLHGKLHSACRSLCNVTDKKAPLRVFFQSPCNSASWRAQLFSVTVSFNAVVVPSSVLDFLTTSSGIPGETTTACTLRCPVIKVSHSKSEDITLSLCDAAALCLFVRGYHYMTSVSEHRCCIDLALDIFALEFDSHKIYLCMHYVYSCTQFTSRMTTLSELYFPVVRSTFYIEINPHYMHRDI